MPTDLCPLELPVDHLPADEEAWSFEAALGTQRVLVASEGDASGCSTRAER